MFMINRNECVGSMQTLAMIYVSYLYIHLYTCCSFFVVLRALCHEITLLLLFSGIRNKTTGRKIYLLRSLKTQRHDLKYKLGFLGLKPPHCF